MKHSELIKRLDALLAETAGEAEVRIISEDTDPRDAAETGDIIIWQTEDGGVGDILVANSDNIPGWED